MAKSIWWVVVQQGKLPDFYALCYVDWLNLNLRGAAGFINGSLASCWSEFFVVTCWMLWKHRCSTIIDVNNAFRGDFLSCCVRLTREYVAEFNKPHVTVSQTSEVTSRWQKLSLGWIKANSDGVVRGIDILASAGSVIRDDQGRWVYGYARRLGRCSVLMAELWAAHDILLAAWDLGFHQVQMETDNLDVARILQGSSDALAACSLVDVILMILARQ
ncbi:hypothetical protein V6N11_053805 [Hibiscus sabdariffa]|uniref:RNase H type-1 domain-containing protein n=1 Tax=Hibiscus sabdariffa TaxID=183260 RepID=A0ABR2S2W8_9ROSI